MSDRHDVCGDGGRVVRIGKAREPVQLKGDMQGGLGSDGGEGRQSREVSCLYSTRNSREARVTMCTRRTLEGASF